MKKIIVLVSVVLVSIFLSSCKANDERTLESEIVTKACQEMDIQEENAVLTLVSSEPIPWNDGDAYYYILTNNDKKYLVGVRRSVNKVYDVDVEKEIEE